MPSKTDIPPQDRVKANFVSGDIHMADPFTQALVRCGLADQYFLSALHTALSESSKKDSFENQLASIGKSWGKEFYIQLQDRIQQNPSDNIHKPQDYLKDEFVEHLNSCFSYSGLGQFRISEGHKFYVISLNNPAILYIEKSAMYIPLFAGFFAGLFSSVAAKELDCAPLTTSNRQDQILFALSLPSVVGEIRELQKSGKSESDILSQYNNQHLL